MGQMGAQIYADNQNTVTEELISERRLWTAVLVHAVEDWRKGTLRARREAQDFLFHNDQDLKWFAQARDLIGTTSARDCCTLDARFRWRGQFN